MKIQYMRRLGIVLAVALTASAVIAQNAKLSSDDYAALMKANQEAFDATDAAVTSGAFEDARVNLAIARRNFMTLRSFWSERTRADAVRVVNDGLYRFSQIEELLGHKQVPVEQVQQSLKDFRSQVCAACHDSYREGSAQSGFHFKKGVL